ncbi:ABC transporter substrate-binding protein [Chelatococcus sp. GCM10030263]|uniref:ABC transporter substrate-binding protein n=1 Tax=Chelatococcus sp. GCM10030263 TaxID=3273387 RepID=UPI00360CE218
MTPLLTRRDMLLFGAGLAFAGSGRARAASPIGIKVGVLQFGTVSWEIEAIRKNGLDAEHGIRVEAVPLASNEAARIAFQAGNVDTIVTDLLLAARLRAEGMKVVYLPFSASEGALMVPPASSITGVADLAGKKIGVAGGALDKSWLLLQAYAKREAKIDLASSADPVFGAPPLLAEKLRSGEFDAALLYWNYCARLEPAGFRKLIGVDRLTTAFGAQGQVALLGYIFSEDFVARRAQALEAFAAASAQAKQLLARSDAAWDGVRPLMRVDDDDTFAAMRRGFIEGIPSRPMAEEQADAARVYAVLADLGGDRLIGPAKSLPAGLYWEGRADGP